jgi:hypothetical protein
MPLLPPVTTAVDPAKPKSIESPSVGLRYAKSAQAEADDLFANVMLIAIAGRPLAFDTCPDRAVDRQRVGWRVDARENPGGLSLLELFDERLQDLPVGIADELGCREHLRLGL